MDKGWDHSMVVKDLPHPYRKEEPQQVWSRLTNPNQEPEEGSWETIQYHDQVVTFAVPAGECPE